MQPNPPGEVHKFDHLKNEKHADDHGSCADCRWWHALDEESIPFGDNARHCGKRPGRNVGECRVSEPQLACYSEEGKQCFEGIWPMTYDVDWCGKFQAEKGKGGLAGMMKI